MTALLETIRSQADTDSVVTVLLHVNRGQGAAVTLYTGLGFTITDEMAAVLGDGKEHQEYRMEKVLR